MQDAIICDVDGTVALMKGKRSPFEYHKADKDEPNIVVINTVLAMKELHQCKLIMLSARENVVLNTPSTDNKWSHTYVNEKYDDLEQLTSHWLNYHPKDIEKIIEKAMYSEDMNEVTVKAERK